MDEMDNSDSMEKPMKKSYGGRSKLFWFWVYVVGALVVYGLIYWLFLRDSGSGGTDTGGGLYGY